MSRISPPVFPHSVISSGSHRAFWLALALTVPALGQAQSFCSSDGMRAPVVLLERFVSSDCASCWTDAKTPRVGKNEIALDWVVPSAQGDAAPLAAVAIRDTLKRLEALKLPPQPGSWSKTAPIAKAERSSRLRVAHGLPVGGYLGTSIELKPVPRAAAGHTWTAWLALVETLPAGTEASPVERNLVRNLLQVDWKGDKPPKGQPDRLYEARSMRLAEGVDPARVRMVGWVESEDGRVQSAAVSRCALAKP